MNAVNVHQALARLRFLHDFERAFQIITGQEEQRDQIEAVEQVKGGERDETHNGTWRQAEGIENDPRPSHEQDRQ
ncbi:MAG: hypothetical protein L6300_12605 [Syntrophaceae bacterium]|nr:hypothetical protein [Syntrophaceae bacterium]